MSTPSDRPGPPPAPKRRADAVRNRDLALAAATALLAEPGASLTVEAIAQRAGLGAATVVRAFGGKDALLDAAVAQLLEPVVRRARDLLAATTPYQALRTFLRELIAFQSAHHAINDQLTGLDLPATTALRADLVGAVEAMTDGARRDGRVRADLDPAVTTALIGATALAVARAEPSSPGIVDAYLTVLLDGLDPRPSG
ncbi:TetR family transcriptional regulator [Kitasatospora sp. NBC_00240]|uniref:TetR/AcrR family transcriptional regulator n=1 Tax=Kitasatospora sp. NBC_00240 TaxID=2903567 RepID=UPI002253DB69|nr:TetR/AcrR family transcriptional regulator [Kitasatospora sp. NBC_00240]MCX5214341.1 TetR family transcriptional regulator [Kitasatospora sp. NBC_00240]